MNIKELIEKHGSTNENWLILEYLTGKKSVELKMDLRFCVDSIYNDFLEIIEKRKQNYPLQYIFGKWEFYGLELFVDESALIPRFETIISKFFSFIFEKISLSKKSTFFRFNFSLFLFDNFIASLFISIP